MNKDETYRKIYLILDIPIHNNKGKRQQSLGNTHIIFQFKITKVQPRKKYVVLVTQEIVIEFIVDQQKALPNPFGKFKYRKYEQNKSKFETLFAIHRGLLLRYKINKLYM